GMRFGRGAIVTSKLRVGRLLIVGVLAAVATRDLSAQILTRLPTPPQSPSAAPSSACLGSLMASPKLDAALQRWARTAAEQTQQVSVAAAPGALPAVTSLLATLGSAALGSLPGINALVARVDLGSAAALVCASSVSSISLDAIVAATGDVESHQPPASLRQTLGLPQNTPAGSGVTVAVIDSGIAASADLGDRITAFFDLSNGLLPLPTS